MSEFMYQNEVLEQVEKYIYLGRIITEDFTSISEIKVRLIMCKEKRFINKR